MAAGPRREELINRVVVATLDGRRLRGFVYDLNTNNEEFHIFASEDLAEDNAEVIRIGECKAIFFVRSHTGNPAYRENKTTLPPGKRLGRPFAVVFGDGERIVGTVEVFHEDRQGFYLVPPDPRSNNLRIFVVSANTREIRNLEVAGSDAPSVEWTAPDPVLYPSDKRCEVVLRLLRGDETRALSREVFLERAVLRYWRSRFLEAGKKALADGAEAAGGDGGRGKPLSLDRRVEAVHRLLSRESAEALSQEYLVPRRVLEAWHDWFVEAGRHRLDELTEEEGREDPAAVRARYDSLDRRHADGGVTGFLEGLGGA